MLVVSTFYTVNRLLTICYWLITSTRIMAIFFWTTAFHLTLNTKTWIPTWLFTVIPDESNRTIWNDVKLFLCFLDFYSLFVKMDYINIKKKFPFCWKKCLYKDDFGLFQLGIEHTTYSMKIRAYIACT